MKLFHYKQLLLEYATLDKTRPYSPDELSKMYDTDYKVHFDENGELILGKVIENGKVIGVQSVHSTKNYFSQAIPYIADKWLVAGGGCGSTYYGAGFYTATDPSIINDYKGMSRTEFNLGITNSIGDLFDELDSVIKNFEKVKRHAIIKTSVDKPYLRDIRKEKYWSLMTALNFDVDHNADMVESFEKTISSMSTNLWTKHCPEGLQDYSFLCIDYDTWKDSRGRLKFNKITADSKLVYPLTSLALRLHYYFKYARSAYFKYIKEATNILLSPQYYNIFRKRLIIDKRSIAEILDERTLNTIIIFLVKEILSEELRLTDKSPKFKTLKKAVQEFFDIDIPSEPATEKSSFLDKALNKFSLDKSRKDKSSRFLKIFNLIKSSTSFEKNTLDELLDLISSANYALHNEKQSTDYVNKLWKSTFNKIEWVTGTLGNDYLAKQLRKFFSLLLKYGEAIAPEITNSISENIYYGFPIYYDLPKENYSNHNGNPEYIMAYLAFTIPPETRSFPYHYHADYCWQPYNGHSEELIWSYILTSSKSNFKVSAYDEFSRLFNIHNGISHLADLPAPPNRFDKKYNGSRKAYKADLKKYKEAKKKYDEKMSSLYRKNDVFAKGRSIGRKIVDYENILTIIPEVLKTSYPKVKRIIKNTVTQEFTNLNEKLKNKKVPVDGFTYVYFSKIFVKPGDVLPLHLPVLTNENFLDLKKIFGKEDITREKCSKLPTKLHPCVKNMLTAEIDTGRKFFAWLLQHDGTLYDFDSRTGYLIGMDIYNALCDFLGGMSIFRFFQRGHSISATSDAITKNEAADILVKCGINATEQEQHLDNKDHDPNYIILNKDITRVVAKLRFVESSKPYYYLEREWQDCEYKVIPTTQEREAKTIKLWKDTLNNIIKNICDKIGVKKENVEKIINNLNHQNIIRNIIRNITDDDYYSARKYSLGSVNGLLEKISLYLDKAFHVMGNDTKQPEIIPDIVKTTLVALTLSDLILFKNTHLFESRNQPITVGQLLNEYRFRL
jgi:hypothetical protein